MTEISRGGIALSTREQRAATTAMARTSNEINNQVKAEDDAIQGARDTLSRLSGNARNTQQLLERFHV